MIDSKIEYSMGEFRVCLFFINKLKINTFKMYVCTFVKTKI